MNAGAVLVANIIVGDIDLATPTVVTTQVPHTFITGMVVTCQVPIVNGLQNPTAPSYLYKEFFVNGIITVVDDVTFSLPGDSIALTPYANILPCYAVPATYSCSQYVTSTFTPAYRLISNVTRAFPALVTTVIPHRFLTGLVVRLMMPPGIGMFQADQKTGTITVIDPVTFSIPLDTTNFDAFVIYPPNRSSKSYINICALAVPIGEDNSILYQATQNVLPL